MITTKLDPRRAIRRDRNDATRKPSAVRAGAPRDQGSTLVLALIFLVVIGAVVGGIASWTSNDLQNTLVFQQASNVQNCSAENRMRIES